jgi:hypothetical protein
MTYSFNSKESYLQYRAAWKRRYAALAADIRELKFCRKRSSIDSERYERMRQAYGNAFGFWPQSLCWHLRQRATALLEELKLAKAEAQRQYLAAHAVPVIS